MNPYVFIVGCSRSGTTLLRRMLNVHPRLAMTRETHWIPKFYEERDGVTEAGLATPSLVSKLSEEERFLRMAVAPDDVARLVAQGPISYADLVSRVFDSYAEAQGKPLAGDKCPGYVRKLSLLHELWPGAKFVHLVRDGRDVCLSYLEWSRAEKHTRRFAAHTKDTVVATAFWWEWNVRLGREDGGSLSDGLYREVLYEPLVSDPAREAERLCSFLDLPYDPTMLAYHEGKARGTKARSAKSAWLPPTPGLRDWRSEMPREQIERFEAVAGALLDELGYECGVRPLPRRLVNQAQAARKSIVRDLRSRGKRIPRAWLA